MSTCTCSTTARCTDRRAHRESTPVVVRPGAPFTTRVRQDLTVDRRPHREPLEGDEADQEREHAEAEDPIEAHGRGRDRTNRPSRVTVT